MNCCQCQGIEDLFNEKSVASELSHYHRKGPAKTTRMMVDALTAQGVTGAALLDIGGGVGAVQHELLSAGAQHAVDVDASQAYLNAARKEANRRGLAERVRFLHGNFVDIAGQISPAEIVTLDRVLCCYPDMEKLVELSAERATRLYGLVYPRDAWWVKISTVLLNMIFRLQRNPFRTFVHPTQAVEALINKHGLRRKFYRRTLIWQVVVYGR